MPNKTLLSGLPLNRKKYTLACKSEYMRQVAASTRQTNVARAQDPVPVLLSRWQR